MKTKTKTSALVREPLESEIRDYAYHLYVQNGSAPGHDEENWLEAKACLEANIPKERAHTRLHRHRQRENIDVVEIIAIETSVEPVLEVARARL